MKDPKDFNLLIVEDEDALRKTLKIHFGMDGYNILTASGGDQAFEIVKDKKIHFVISDIKMPKGNGDLLLDKIRVINPKLPVVVMVTGFSELTKERAIEKGALDLLSKPIDLDLMEKYIKDAFDKM